MSTVLLVVLLVCVHKLQTTERRQTARGLLRWQIGRPKNENQVTSSVQTKRICFKSPVSGGRALGLILQTETQRVLFQVVAYALSWPDSSRLPLIAAFRGSLVRWKGFCAWASQLGSFLQLNHRNQLFSKTASLFFPSSPINFILLGHKRKGEMLNPPNQTDLVEYGAGLYLVLAQARKCSRRSEINKNPRRKLFRVCFEMILCCCAPQRQRGPTFFREQRCDAIPHPRQMLMPGCLRGTAEEVLRRYDNLAKSNRD